MIQLVLRSILAAGLSLFASSVSSCAHTPQQPTSISSTQSFDSIRVDESWTLPHHYDGGGCSLSRERTREEYRDPIILVFSFSFTTPRLEHTTGVRTVPYPLPRELNNSTVLVSLSLFFFLSFPEHNRIRARIHEGDYPVASAG